MPRHTLVEQARTEPFPDYVTTTNSRTIASTTTRIHVKAGILVNGLRSACWALTPSAAASACAARIASWPSWPDSARNWRSCLVRGVHRQPHLEHTF